MIDLIIALAASIVNIYILYMLWIRQGFPGMFENFNGILSVGLFAAAFGYLVMSLLTVEEGTVGEEAPEYPPPPPPSAGSYAEEDYETEKVWRDIHKGVERPNTAGPVAEIRHNNDGGDFLAEAVARAISKAELKGDIGIHIEVPEHEISLGRSKASMRAVINLETPRPRPQTQPPPQTEKEVAVPKDIRRFIEEKISQLESESRG